MNAIAERVPFVFTRNALSELNRVFKRFVVMRRGKHIVGLSRSIARAKTGSVNNIFNKSAFRPNDPNVTNPSTHKVPNQRIEAIALS